MPPHASESVIGEARLAARLDAPPFFKRRLHDDKVGSDRLQLILQQGERDGVDCDNSFGVLDEVTELAVALVADGLVEFDRANSVFSLTEQGKAAIASA